MRKDRQRTHRGRALAHRGRLGFLLVMALGVGLALVACGGSSSDEDGASSGVVQADDLAEPAQEPDTPAGAEGEQAVADAGLDESAAAGDAGEEISPEDAFLVFAQCLREEGLDVSDPDFSSGRGPGGFLRGVDRDDAAVQAALETCRPIIESARPELTADEQAERHDQILAFTACLRDEGLDVEDPTNGGGAGGGFLRGNLDPDDPATQAAIEVCRDEVPGFGGGRFGSGGRG